MHTAFAVKRLATLLALSFTMIPGVLAQSATPVMIKVDPATAGAAISDLVYGANDFNSPANNSLLPYPIVRFGGNPTSRYNWRDNVWNAAKDWYYLNAALPYTDLPGHPHLSYTDRLILRQATAGRDVLITLPIIGWVAKARSPAWGYSVRKYGPQQSVEHDQSHGDAGNGQLPDGKPLLIGDPTDTSVPADPQFIADWVTHNRALTKGLSSGVRYYAMDNEPSLWHETHQDLRYGDRSLPQPELGYDELWARTVAYASAVKKADPQAKIIGPVEWGWCGYITSARDHCKPGADRKAHGDLPLLRWYMQQVRAYEQRTGVRLIDYLDVHYYPAAETSQFDESPDAQAKRLMATRSLYDANFTDGSWIKEPIQLLPRLQGWIKQDCPGLGIALSEYRFGESPDGLSSTLANAETLAIFGKGGVGLATFWGELHKDSLLEAAFRFYLNYDGKGASALHGQTMDVQSSDALLLPAYGIAAANKRLVYIFNKSPQPREVQVAGMAGWHLRRRFLLAQGTPLAEQPAAAAIRVPPMSAVLLEWTP